MPSTKADTIALRVDDLTSTKIQSQAAQHDITHSALLQHLLIHATDALWKRAALSAIAAKNSPKDIATLQNQRRQMASRLRKLDAAIEQIKTGGVS